MIFNENRYRNLLENNQRFNERQINEVRKLELLKTKNNLEVSLGNTKVFCKIFKEVVEPTKERPNEGIINFKLNLSVRNNTKINQSNEDLSNHILKVLERGIKNSKAIDIDSLVILNGKYVWKLLIELSLLHDDGNIIDAMFYASILSLKMFKKNFVGFEEGNIRVYNEEEKGMQKLSINFFPLNFTYGIINYYNEENNTENYVIIDDPDLLEESIIDTFVSITVNEYSEVCNIIQPGKKPINIEILNRLIQKSVENNFRFDKLKEYLDSEKKDSFSKYKVLKFN